MTTRRDFLKLAGASLVGVTGVASASENPFGLKKMESGYTQVAMEGKCGGKAKPSEGKCGEGKCGGKAKSSEGKCGEGKCGGKAKSSEGKCGEGKCGGKAKSTEGKCGEGKCGGMKD